MEYGYDTAAASKLFSTPHAAKFIHIWCCSLTGRGLAEIEKAHGERDIDDLEEMITVRVNKLSLTRTLMTE